MRLALFLMAILPMACSNSPLDTTVNTDTGTSTGTGTSTSTSTPTAVRFAVHDVSSGRPGVLVEVDQTDYDRSSRTWITHIAASDNYLYMGTGSGVYRMPKLGGVVTVVDEDTNAIFRYLASNRQYVVWDKRSYDAEDNSTTLIRRQAIANGSITTLLEGAFGIPNTNVPPSLLQATSNDVFLAYEPRGSNGCDLVRLPISGGNVSAPIFSWKFPGLPQWAVDDQGLFMTTGSGTVAGCQLWAFEAPEFTQRELAPCPDNASQVAGLDGESLYFTSPHSVWKMPRAGGAAVAIATGNQSQYMGWNMVVDQNNVYFVMGYDLLWMPKAGGAVNKLIARSELPGDIMDLAQDAQYLYALSSYKKVVVIPKPAAQ